MLSSLLKELPRDKFREVSDRLEALQAQVDALREDADQFRLLKFRYDVEDAEDVAKLIGESDQSPARREVWRWESEETGIYPFKSSMFGLRPDSSTLVVVAYWLPEPNRVGLVEAYAKRVNPKLFDLFPSSELVERFVFVADSYEQVIKQTQLHWTTLAHAAWRNKCQGEALSTQK
ncbi:MAG: hypothetical protein OHK0046_47520 [Anaerolineae bacterium]